PFTAQAAQGCRAAPTSREAPSWPWQHGSAPPGRRRGGPGGAVACGRPVPARFRLRGPGGGPRGAGEAHAARPEGGRGRREHAAAARVSTTRETLRSWRRSFFEEGVYCRPREPQRSIQLEQWCRMIAGPGSLRGRYATRSKWRGKMGSGAPVVIFSDVAICS
ncbi:unnamed protein product, partial [Prorocentrum cordatum]